MSTHRLTGKQAAFVQEYLVDLNATGAARRAGYSPNGAEVAGHRLLRNVKVAARIDQALQERVERTEVTADWVISKLVENVERAMQAKPVADRQGNPKGEFRYDGAVANQALRHLGQHLGMFKDRVELKVDVLERLASLPISRMQELEALGDEELMAALKHQVWQ
jgi:phage terminase small subunit